MGGCIAHIIFYNYNNCSTLVENATTLLFSPHVDFESHSLLLSQAIQKDFNHDNLLPCCKALLWKNANNGEGK